jgi:type I restriction enzyme S subunit
MEVPTLRFPEFTSKWEKKKLGEISNEIMYGMNAAAIPFDGKNKYLRITDIDEDSRTFIPKPLTSPDGVIEKKYKLKVGDILFTRTGASVGKSYLYNSNDGNLFFAGFLIKFSIIGANPYLIFSQTLTSNYNKWVLKMSMRSGQPGLNAEEYKDFQVSFPSLPEQQKIASFLTAVDEKLQALKKKKNLLEHYKKGVMQKIFSQKLRFKNDDGSEFPEWEEKTLGEITYKVDKKNKHKEQLPIFSISNQNGFVPQSEQFEGLDSNDRGYDISLYKIVEKETFAYNPARINVGSIGYSGKEIERVIISSLYVCFKTNLEIDDKFFLLYLQTEHFKNLVIKKGEGGVRIYLFYENFSEITIDVPFLEEQIKIANFLNAIDEKINHVQGQIQKMELWKKGLLQKMFV